jgi:hypothetical protein
MPFPWFFEESMPWMKDAEGQGTSKDGLVVPPEVRVTVLIPSSFLPTSRPHKLRLWGGGLLPPPPVQLWPVHANLNNNAAGNGAGPSSTSNTSGPGTTNTPNPLPTSYHPMHAPRRRIYTDDSDILACAVHAGLLTWSAVSRAQRDEKDIKIVLGVVPTVSSFGGSVPDNGSNRDHPPTNIGTAPVNGTPSNGVTPAATNGITPSTSQSSASQPIVSSHANGGSGIAGATALDGMGYAGGVWASRFVGGWGEAFYGHASAGHSPANANGEVRQRTFEEEAEDDGRGVVSAGWGWGHDGSALEVVDVEVVEVSILPFLRRSFFFYSWHTILT